MKKKLQIFISSTYQDLIEERQSAVEAILRAGNIPAGMELFTAGDKSQLETIKRWIEESDIYLLILGGRYGSIDEISNLSYTELEYKYAIKLKKPFFAVVLNDEMMEQKVKKDGQKVLELDNQDSYKKFKKLVLSKICKLCSNTNDIKLAVLESIIDIQNHNKLLGWIKGDEIPDSTSLIKEIDFLRKERDQYKLKFEKAEVIQNKTKNNFIGEYSFEEIYNILEKTELILNMEKDDEKKEIKTNALDLFIKYFPFLTTGVSNYWASADTKMLIKTLIPILMSFDLVERSKHKDSSSKIDYDKYYISKNGNKFYSTLNIEAFKKK